MLRRFLEPTWKCNDPRIARRTFELSGTANPGCRQSCGEVVLESLAGAEIGADRLSGLRGMAGFTLIELMVVMGILAVVLTISIPSIYRQLRPDSLQKALEDFMDACRYARGRAILEGKVSELVIRPGDRTISVVATGEKGRGDDGVGAVPSFSPSVSGEEWRSADRGKPSGHSGEESGSIFSAKLSDHIRFEGIGINGLDWTEDAESRVKFYPNGTSDEMSVVLLQTERGERRNITLEVVTALAEFEVDPTKFKVR